MGKMHELIAAESSIAATYNSMREETAKVFDKPDAFVRSTTVVTYFDDAESHLNTTETKELTTTVADRLEYFLSGAFVGYLDLQLNKDLTNQLASAELEIDGKVLAAGIPATMFLQLEKELSTLRNVVLKAPTLAPGFVWEREENEDNLFRTREPKVSFRTKKTVRPIVLVPPTDKHPAQVDKVNEDVPVAKIEQRIWSGMLSSSQKADYLSRIDALLVAVKKARQRANSVEATKASIGKTIADFILSGKA